MCSPPLAIWSGITSGQFWSCPEQLLQTLLRGDDIYREETHDKIYILFDPIKNIFCLTHFLKWQTANPKT